MGGGPSRINSVVYSWGDGEDGGVLRWERTGLSLPQRVCVAKGFNLRSGPGCENLALGSNCFESGPGVGITAKRFTNRRPGQDPIHVRGGDSRKQEARTRRKRNLNGGGELGPVPPRQLGLPLAARSLPSSPARPRSRRRRGSLPLPPAGSQSHRPRRQAAAATPRERTDCLDRRSRGSLGHADHGEAPDCLPEQSG
ncbi:hypothetical protein H8959_009056 [Pygathrix nigripes]